MPPASVGRDARSATRSSLYYVGACLSTEKRIYFMILYARNEKKMIIAESSVPTSSFSSYFMSSRFSILSIRLRSIRQPISGCFEHLRPVAGGLAEEMLIILYPLSPSRTTRVRDDVLSREGEPCPRSEESPDTSTRLGT